MAHVRLHAAHGDFLTGPKMLAEDFGQGGDFGGIADLRGGGVHFDVLQVFDFELIVIGPADGFDLAFLPRCPKALALPVGGNPDPANDGLNFVARCERGFQGFEAQNDVTIRSHEAVGVGIEGPAAGGTDRLSLREQH